MKYTVFIIGLILVASCASNPKTIGAAYISPLKYKDNDCDQISQEMAVVADRTSVLYQSLSKERTADNWQMGVGLVLFWPALLFLEGGDGPEATEFATLKGEYQALYKISMEKACTITSMSPDEMFNAYESAYVKANEEEKKVAKKKRKGKKRHFIL